MMSHFSVLFTPFRLLMLLPPETASLRESGPAPGGLTEDSGATSADNNSLGVAENCRDPGQGGGYNETPQHILTNL